MCSDFWDLDILWRIQATALATVCIGSHHPMVRRTSRLPTSDRLDWMERTTLGMMIENANSWLYDDKVGKGLINRPNHHKPWQFFRC